MNTDASIDYENQDIRRDIIRRLYYAAKSLQSIIIVLDRRDALAGLTFSDKVRLVKGELNTIKQEDKAALIAVRKDADEAWADYVARQHFLYEVAVEDRDVTAAQSLSKDIARAHGVRTDAPIEVKTDIGEMLRQASMARRPEPQRIEKKEAITLLPKDFAFKKTVG